MKSYRAQILRLEKRVGIEKLITMKDLHDGEKLFCEKESLERQAETAISEEKKRLQDRIKAIGKRIKAILPSDQMAKLEAAQLKWMKDHGIEED